MRRGEGEGFSFDVFIDTQNLSLVVRRESTHKVIGRKLFHGKGLGPWYMICRHRSQVLDRGLKGHTCWVVSAWTLYSVNG